MSSTAHQENDIKAPAPVATGSVVESDEAFFHRIFGNLTGGLATLSVYIGAKTGLYKTLAELGPCTPKQLAEKSGYHFRWVQEWLFVQASNKLVCHEGHETFSMTDVQKRALIGDSQSASYATGVSHLLKAMAQSVDKTAEAFSTGMGCNYDHHGFDIANGIAQLQSPWCHHHLVPTLCSISGVESKLTAGVKVADVGCGGGEALLVLAEKFPRSQFYGYDISECALALARKRLEASGVKNVRFCNPHHEQERLPEDGSFPIIINIDAIHDMADPASVVDSIAKSLAKDGVWISSEPVSNGSLDANIGHPLAPTFSGLSLFLCMSSAMSEPNSNGFGAMALSHEKFEKLCSQSGLHIVQAHDGKKFSSPINTIYEIRPAAPGASGAQNEQ